MRILVAHNVPPARTNGMSRIMSFTHDWVVKAGHTVDYFCAADVPERWRGSRARLIFPWLVRRRAIEAHRAGMTYDVVNVHEPSAAALALAKDKAGNPWVVVTSHGVEARGWERTLEEHRLGRGAVSWKTRLVYPPTALWQARLGLHYADHVCCLNEEDKAYLNQHFRISDTRLTRIGPGADEVFAQPRDYSRNERLLFAGTWLKRKGSSEVIAAFAELAQCFPRLRLTILGGGQAAEVIKADFPAELCSRVDCAQTSSEAETAAAFAASDIYLLPSLFEGTPLTLMEAMMSGLPIVTTDTCGMRDVIQDGRNGLLVPLRAAESIVRATRKLLESETLRARLGIAAQADAQTKYTWQQAAQPVLQLYEKLGPRKGN